MHYIDLLDLCRAAYTAARGAPFGGPCATAFPIKSVREWESEREMRAWLAFKLTDQLTHFVVMPFTLSEW